MTEEEQLARYFPEMASKMTLRDYFAGQALQGLCARSGDLDPRWFAGQAYQAADAMLARRVQVE